MIEIVKTINGVKQLVPLTTDSGQGLPLGAITAFYGTTPPNGYLICDGSEFSTTDYPALYTFLGDNHTPDLRECVLVGAGQSDNDYDAVTNPNGIHDHDVYTLGEFKDDQLQDHGHKNTWQDENGAKFSNGSNYNIQNFTSGTPPKTASNCRTGTTTHGKQKGVNFIIKAVIGPIEDSAADQVVQNINNSRSYSTEEVNTGKTWIDGKPIYRKVTGLFTKGGTVEESFPRSEFDTIIDTHVVAFDHHNESDGGNYSGQYTDNTFTVSSYWRTSTQSIYAWFSTAVPTGANFRVVVEYTKP